LSPWEGQLCALSVDNSKLSAEVYLILDQTEATNSVKALSVSETLEDGQAALKER
jgi:hypothetical protein